MDSKLAAQRLNPGDRGFSSLQFLIASSLALVFFVALANVVVVQYASGALRSALDQGVRAGSLARSEGACEARVGEVVSEVLGGSIGESVEFECRIEAGVVAAEGWLRVDSWTPFTGDYLVSLVAEALLEPNSA